MGKKNDEKPSEEVDVKNVEKSQKDEPKKARKTLVSAAEYWNFEDNDVFVGQYLDEQIAEIEDKETGIKAAKVIGYMFVDDDGVEWLISNSHAIEKALKLEYEKGKTVQSEHDAVRISFLGQLVLKKTGQPYNNFKVELL